MGSRESELKIIFLFFDLLILNLAISLVAWMRFDISIDDLKQTGTYVLHANLSWLITFSIFSKKNLYLRDSFMNRLERITKRTMIFILIASVLGFIFMPRYFSRAFFLEYAALFFVGKVIFYYFLYKYLKFRREKGLNTLRSLIIGYNDTSLLLQRMIASNPLLGYQFCGFLTSKTNVDDHILGTPDDLIREIEKQDIQLVFISVSLIAGENNNSKYLEICNRMGVRVRFVPQNQRWFKSRMNMESVGNLVVINPQEIPLDDIGARVSKRVFDLVFSLIIIIAILSWLVPIIGAIIKLTSKGPVFFIQKRTGLNNKVFYCLKFRSMAPNNQADSHQAKANDGRITPIGHFLRKTNLDEFPQFFNVLIGQMSVVGPRPHMLKHTEEYAGLIDQYLTRHYIKPGVTGWAQINGYRGETDELWKMEKRVKYDREYIENWTFIWDFNIIWKTIFSSKARENAR
ncbi:undecaprenyl-phosphate glucose phosphotransferase [Mangrovibacterium lignilyticum]|uniref:undecaprenyl-phosphate glucose phosphotransferase n=1 Tax=Mangrovibacterium lignilyticum TaxID=2668052 RepID=UPI0013D60DC6|nr:undecaprenyl-phosphate glucose phosphotransferase [Mangrovibacterium lignilyticum]